MGPLTAGFLLYALLYILLLRTRVSFVEVFEHEMIHLLVGKLFFKDIQELLVNADEGGHVQFRQAINSVIWLAPYSLPLLTLPLFLVRYFVSAPITSAIDFLIGFTMAFHLVGLVKEFRFSQPDLRQSGRAFSLSFVLLANSFWIALMAAIVTEDLPILSGSFSNMLAAAIAIYQEIFDFFAGILNL